MALRNAAVLLEVGGVGYGPDGTANFDGGVVDSSVLSTAAVHYSPFLPANNHVVSVCKFLAALLLPENSPLARRCWEGGHRADWAVANSGGSPSLAMFRCRRLHRYLCVVAVPIFTAITKPIIIVVVAFITESSPRPPCP